MIYVIYAKSELRDYLLCDAKMRTDISLFEVNTFFTYLRILKRILPKYCTKYPIFYLRSNSIRQLRKMNSDDRLLVLGHTSVEILTAINNIIPKEVIKFLYIWNPLLTMRKGKEEVKKLLNMYNNIGYNIFTFNKYDAFEFDINLTTQIYKILPLNKENENCLYDFYFLGYKKNRTIDPFDLEAELKKRGYKTLFIVKEKNGKSISYIENIENIKKSKVIVDLTQVGQDGLTIRPLEAISFQKKLLTNNYAVMDEPFFNSHNVMTINSLPLNDSIDEFVNYEYQSIKSEMFLKYDVNNWIDTFK